ncbi:DNA-binding response regulator, OmpR family, contains REC and winged-helix (wHTH) domain [Ruminococcus sp. YE71]|uniref:response regulator transcription factor n=1 Tax=unclassified Ruminococcus TaxID=2608920 RepID=UPI0008810D22|nr:MULTISPECIES: response regulator transcription factor [unclassified Ruminococcus]SDA20607.1 DNA-binding response regulator, OmpR family, contains REC and winged-helix (wHTH) domain [Ruminococcus sp. YE78]SFW33955.1 DNA-binding response regulator, OmpR family, contains REC and winged-helix (wHTH) domain [Ruminococcus sp. YE71]
MKKIMIIEDESALRDELSIMLRNAGYDTVVVTDFENVSGQMTAANADLILLDINLPNVNGETLLQEFRKGSDTPVIMLTSRTTELDEVLSMSYGADDYITKPYNPTILLLRISAVLKRTAKVSQVQNYHDIEVSTVKGSLSRGGKEQILTKNEMIIFQLLLDRQGEIVTRDDLMTALWDNDEFVNDNALSVNISRLRGKLADMGLPDAIETRKKQGYVLK